MNDYLEQFLFFRPVRIICTGEQICKKIYSFVSNFQSLWSDWVSVFSFGGPPMMGSSNGLMSFVMKKNENIMVVHCLRHRENLAAKQMQEGLAIVLKQVVSIAN